MEILHFGLQGKPSGGEGDKRYCSKGFETEILIYLYFHWNSIQVWGEPSPPPPLPPHPPSPPSTPPEGQPEMETEVELNSFLSPCHHHIFLLVIILLLLSRTWRWRLLSSSSPSLPRDLCSTTVRRRLWKFLSISFFNLNFCQIEIENN